MGQGKVQPLLPVPLGEERLFPLHHSLHPCSLQVTTSCLSRQRLVGDIPKGLGDLYSIFSLLGGDKMEGIVSICCRKLRRMTTRWLLKVGTMFLAKPGDGTGVNTSG